MKIRRGSGGRKVKLNQISDFDIDLRPATKQ
jgi:hypothetical protein